LLEIQLSATPWASETAVPSPIRQEEATLIEPTTTIAVSELVEHIDSFLSLERSPCHDGKDMDVEESCEVRQGVRQGDAFARLTEGWPASNVASALNVNRAQEPRFRQSPHA
jgi:hypothetical protein